MPKSWLLRVSTALICVAALGASAQAQRTRGLTPVPSNDNSPVNLSVTLDQKEPRVGTMVSICFDASKAGYATLWNISTAGEVVRVFPNQYSKVGPAAQIEAGRKYCAGTGGDPFRFRVDGPTGTEDLFLVWTTRTDLQPNGTNYTNGDGLVQDLQRLGGANSSEWATSKVTYDIVPPGGAVTPVVPTPQVSGNVGPPAPRPPPSPPRQTADNTPPAPRPTPAQEADAPKVWVFAMGANVGTLTKSNQDAAMFTVATAKIFSVPDSNVRFVENGKNADFVAGMEWLTDVASPQDYVFIYFSGHGGRVHSKTSDDGWDEFLVPYDFQTAGTDDKFYLGSQRIAFLINRLQTKNVVAVIDACHSAGVTRALSAEVLGARKKFYHLPPGTDEDKVAAALTASIPQTRAAGGRGRIKANGLLLAAARRDQYALEGSNGSYFTLALIHEMISNDGGSLVDVFGRSVKLTEQLSENKQDPEAVGDLEMGRDIHLDPQ